MPREASTLLPPAISTGHAPPASEVSDAELDVVAGKVDTGENCDCEGQSAAACRGGDRVLSNFLYPEPGTSAYLSSGVSMHVVGTYRIVFDRGVGMRGHAASSNEHFDS